MVNAGEKGRIAQVDAITDAWGRVTRLEEEWQELNGEMCFTPEEREDEPLWQELKQARERLRTIQQATARESRGTPPNPDKEPVLDFEEGPTPKMEVS